MYLDYALRALSETITKSKVQVLTAVIRRSHRIEERYKTQYFERAAILMKTSDKKLAKALDALENKLQKEMDLRQAYHDLADAVYDLDVPEVAFINKA